MNEVVAFSEPKATILDQSLGLEGSSSNLEKALSIAQLSIVTTTVGWLISSVARSFVGWGFCKVWLAGPEA